MHNASHQRSGQALRRAYVDFFVRAGHTEVPSSPLVPQGDNSLMFVNAGMVQFKHVFVGAEARPYKRAVSVQKCMRVSGKHNDLEEVGRTARHHTLFEMLGNFSFGDYFKEEAISLAWRFCTQELGLPPERLWVTTFAGDEATPADDEARQLWRRISGLPEGRIVPMGAADNFWSMGETGPCGPCTEIHVDMGSGPANVADFANGRIVEIWNNVFMQYERDASGALQNLAAPGVDTGMGLERVAALAQGQTSNYHTDLFAPLLARIGEVAGRDYGRGESENDVSMRVIADHARAAAFLVADGVQPSSDGRGYVLRRIMRRAIRHGQRLGIERNFFDAITAEVVATMHGAYPELHGARALIAKVSEAEEESFRRTLGGGLKVLSTALGGLLEHVKQGAHPTLSGEVAFKLYDTFGFPKDLTDTIAEEHGVRVDNAGFDAMMQQQQERSRGKLGGAGGPDPAVYQAIVREVGATSFIGYPHEDVALGERPGRWREHAGEMQAECSIVALVQNGERVARAAAGDEVQVVLDPCPLYGEGGGQVGDAGGLWGTNEGAGRLAEVKDAKKPVAELTVLNVVAAGAGLQVGQRVWAGYDAKRRRSLRAHHSATHLLHHALRKVLGEHVAQAGSLVEAERLRFDFAHFTALTGEQMRAIETEVQAEITAHHPVITEELTLEAARSKGAVALFGEKYGERVRVLSMGESIEFCGGTHAANTGEIGMLLLTREQAVQAGVRRLEAEVGEAARRRGRRLARRLAHVAQQLGAAGCAQVLERLADGAPNDPREGVDGDAEATPTLEAATKLREAVAAAAARMIQADGPALPTTSQALGVTTPALPQALDAPTTYALRDTWQAVSALLTGRATEAGKLRAALGEADVGHLAAGVSNLQAALKEAERTLGAAKDRGSADLAKRVARGAKTLGNGVVLAVHLFDDENEVAQDLKTLADHVRDALGEGAVGLAACRNGRVTLLVALTKGLVPRFAAGKLVGKLAPHIGGRGGGRPDMAQAGGQDAAGVPEAFAELERLLAAG